MSTAISIALIETGRANIASVEAAFARLGFNPLRTTDSKVVASASHVVLPGVGAFGSGMNALLATGLDSALKERFANNRPTLCVCLGLQLLCSTSDETPGVHGLDLVPGSVERFTGKNLPIPQLGWNSVGNQASSENQTRLNFIKPGFAYFANSYCLKREPEGWAAAWSHYGEPFVAAMERGTWLACQFHPELSGTWGATLLQRWVRGTTGSL